MTTYVSHHSVWRNPVHFIAFGFGSGTIRLMPGTFGSLIAIPIYLVMVNLSFWLYLSLVCCFFLGGIWICGKTAKDLNFPDYSGIVWDEIVGMLFALSSIRPGFLGILIVFLLFRLFDIWKPWPIHWFNQHLKNGFGVMLDDALAAIYAILIIVLFKITVTYQTLI